MPAVKVTSERDSTALIFQLKARTSGAKVLAAYSKQTLLDTEGARLCRAEDGSAVDLARPLLDQIADGELLTVTEALAAAAAPEEEPEPRAEDPPEEEAPLPLPEPPSMDASFEQIAIPEPPMDAFLARELEELAVEREAAVAVVDAAEATALGAADAALALEVARAASEVALPLRSFVFSCYPDRLAALDAVGASMGAALRDGDAPILVVGGVGAGAVAVALGAERGAGEAVRVVAWPRGAVGAGCAAKLAKENGVDVEIYAGGGHEVDLVEGMPSEEGALGGVVLDVGDDGFVEPEALRRLAALARAGLVNAATPVAPRTVQVVGVLAARDSDACAGFDCSAFDRRLRCDLPRESLRATEACWREASRPFALRTWSAAATIAAAEDAGGRTVTVAEATTTVLGGVACAACWLRLDYGDGVVLETKPPPMVRDDRGDRKAGERPWRYTVIPLPGGRVAVDAGEKASLEVACDGFLDGLEVRSLALDGEEAFTNINPANNDRLDVPRWHWPMLADEPRNACFARAIERAVARAAKRRRGEADEEVHVLDIGAGSGLLSLAAKRAGAASCVAVEAQPSVAAAAVSCVLDNLGGEEARVAPRSPADDDGALDVEVDGVRVVSRHSSALYVEDDEYDVRDDDDASSDDDAGPAPGRSALPRRADVLVSEIFGQALLEEGCVSTFVDATERLLTDDADVVPARGAIHATPVEWPARKSGGGVDYGSLVCLHRAMGAADDVYSSVLLDEDVVDVAPPQPAFDFDFRWPEDARPGVCELVFTAQRDAVVTAIALHFDLDMDDAETYDSRTCDGWHWGRPVYVLPTPVRVAAGATLPVTLATNGDFPQLHRVEKVRVALDAACAAKDLRHGRVAYASEDAANGLVGPMLAAKGRDAKARADLKARFDPVKEPGARAALCLAFVAEFRRLARTPNVAVDPIAVQDLLVNLPYVVPQFALPGDAYKERPGGVAAINGVPFEK